MISPLLALRSVQCLEIFPTVLELEFIPRVNPELRCDATFFLSRLQRCAKIKTTWSLYLAFNAPLAALLEHTIRSTYADCARLNAEQAALDIVRMYHLSVPEAISSFASA